MVVLVEIVVGGSGGDGDGGGEEDGDIRLERFIERTMRRFV